MVGSPTAMASEATEAGLKEAAEKSRNGVYVPSGALWGGEDIRKMADRGTLKVGFTLDNNYSKSVQSSWWRHKWHQHIFRTVWLQNMITTAGHVTSPHFAYMLFDFVEGLALPRSPWLGNTGAISCLYVCVELIHVGPNFSIQNQSYLNLSIQITFFDTFTITGSPGDDAKAPFLLQTRRKSSRKTGQNGRIG